MSSRTPFFYLTAIFNNHPDICFIVLDNAHLLYSLNILVLSSARVLIWKTSYLVCCWISFLEAWRFLPCPSTVVRPNMVGCRGSSYTISLDRIITTADRFVSFLSLTIFSVKFRHSVASFPSFVDIFTQTALLNLLTSVSTLLVAWLNTTFCPSSPLNCLNSKSKSKQVSLSFHSFRLLVGAAFILLLFLLPTNYRLAGGNYQNIFSLPISPS